MSITKTKTISKTTKLQQADDEIRRVHSRMFRWANKLEKLMKARARLVRLDDDERKPIVTPVELPKPDPRPVEKPDDPLDVRSMPWNQRNEADEKAKTEIKAGQLARVRVKAKASAEKSRAKRRGELRKMPLTGKAALAAIREAK
jgi:hypothetical protein